MKPLNRKNASAIRNCPVRIIQFGEGNFLRAFVDWMIDKMNKEIDFNSGIAVVQPIEQGLTDVLNAQDGLYHLYLQGIKDGAPVSHHTLIDAIQQAVNPYRQYTEYMQLASDPHLRFLVSNTTEAGIAYNDKDRPDMEPQDSFPGKITALLYRRYKTFDGAHDKGLIIFCCELIEHNATKLKEHVLTHAAAWNLPAAFTDWVNQSNAFCNTLVDRIVPGFPRDKIDTIQQSLDYEDRLVVEGEYFHVWVIEAPEWVKNEFPAQRAGLNVIFTDDLTPHRELKVRILNGAHTASFAVSLLCGVETVQESIEHPQVGRFMRELVFEEICPNINRPGLDPKVYAEKALERFYNPFIKHLWQSISLNSVSKWQTRVMPSLDDYHSRTNNVPDRLAFSLAALIAFYRGTHGDKSFRIDDGSEIIDFFQSAWSDFNATRESSFTLSKKVLANSDFWQRDLNEMAGLTDSVAAKLFDIQTLGTAKALAVLLNSKSGK